MRIDYLKIIFIFLVLSLIFLQSRLWLESGGVVDMVRLKKQYVVQVAENEKLKKRNQKLIDQIVNLQKSPDAIEAHARSEIGMVKKDEKFYQVIAKANQ